MTLEDFEKQLAEEKLKEEKNRERAKDEGRSKHKHRHNHHLSHRHSSRDDEARYDGDGHRSKRSRHSREDDDYSEDKSHRRHRHRHREVDPDESKSAGGLVVQEESILKRDSWMEAPSALEIDYVQRKKKENSPPKSKSMEANYELKIHQNELNHHLRDLNEGRGLDEIEDEPGHHEVDYTFGDAGSQWRMTKLKAVFREAQKSGRKVEEVAVERFGGLQAFDDAREEEIELDRREAYGKDYVGKIKPSGELYHDRGLKAAGGLGSMRGAEDEGNYDEKVEGIAVATTKTLTVAKTMDQSTLNRLKAKLLRAQMMNHPKAALLEKEYNDAFSTSDQSLEPSTVTLSAMDNRMLSSTPRNEVKAMTGRRAQERGQVEENEDMSIDDMVREERRTRGQAGGEGQRFAERIAKDAKFDNDLDYMDENAGKLAKRVHKSDINLRNTAISDYQKVNRILDNCPLCHREDIDTPPAAPLVSLATRTYLTLPTTPELSPDSALIVPIQHHSNLLSCDDDEWEEIRNFMKSLTRFYHAQGRAVLFYENAAFPNRHPHAAMTVIPLPLSLGDTAPAFFKDAFLTTEDEWSQHKKIIDTLARSRDSGLGKLAFRRSLVKEMPYFHVWFAIDGGLGHVVESPETWPRGDLFARQIIGGMLDLEPDVVKRQGRWVRGAKDDRLERFRAKWTKFDWTSVLTEA